MRPGAARALAIGLVLGLGVAGCGNADAKPSTGRTLTVLAASSLTGTFTDLATQFEAEHPGVKVRLVFDSSATLAQQVVEQAPGDVLATADQKTMEQAKTGGGIHGEPAEFATNVLTLAVPRDNPAKIARLADLDRHGVDYLTCVLTAPCGAAADALLKENHVTRRAVSQEVDVKSVLTKLEADEADAGLVYQTDVTASHGKVTGIAIAGAEASPNTYWVGVAANAADDTLAGDWVTFVTGTEGQAVLGAAGFGTIG